MVLGGGAFGAWLSHEGRILTSGISVQIKGTPGNSLALFLPTYMVKHHFWVCL